MPLAVREVPLPYGDEGVPLLKFVELSLLSAQPCTFLSSCFGLAVPEEKKFIPVVCNRCFRKHSGIRIFMASPAAVPRFNW